MPCVLGRNRTQGILTKRTLSIPGINTHKGEPASALPAPESPNQALGLSAP